MLHFIKKKHKNKYIRRNALVGRLFCLPFYVGFTLLFLFPLLQSLTFAFSKVAVVSGSLKTTFEGWNNFNFVLFQDANFVSNLQLSLINLFYQIPVIIISSLFFVLILNKKFFGIGFVRAVFFIPVIVASGIVIQILKGDVVAGSIMQGAASNSTQAASIFNSSALQSILIASGVNKDVVGYFTAISNNLIDLLWRTGIQTILFLAGLQTIPKSLYEASSIEGATAWEDLWMITIPLITPIILVNTVYTIVDSFTDIGNPAMTQIIRSFNQLNFGQASAMTWLYSLVMTILLAFVLFLFSKNGKEKTIKNRRFK